MKYLLAFALIAVAMALPEPMRLLEPVQLAAPVEPLVVPQEVMDEVALKVKIVDAPETAEAPEAAADFTVNFVDEAVNVDAVDTAVAPEAAADFTVNFVDEAVNVDAVDTAVAPEAAADVTVNFVNEAVNADAPETAADIAVNVVEEAVNVDAAEAVEVNAVKIVDAPVENDASDYAVNFVDEAVNAPEAINLESPMQIKIVDIPLLDSVVMPFVIPAIGNVQFLDAPVERNADFAVKFVDVADVDEETPSYRPIKLYLNPMWR